MLQDFRRDELVVVKTRPMVNYRRDDETADLEIPACITANDVTEKHACFHLVLPVGTKCEAPTEDPKASWPTGGAISEGEHFPSDEAAWDAAEPL